MCFSMEASFGASAVLMGAGVVAFRTAQSPKFIPFALIPIIFSLQQIVEGIIWLTFNHPEYHYLQQPLTYAFILTAKVIYSFWIPFAILKMESNPMRRKILKVLLICGILSAIQMMCGFIFYEVSISNQGMHIDYNFTIPLLLVHQIVYLLACALSFFVSSLKYMKLLGAALVASICLSWIFYTMHAFSVWCFFAALLSVIVILILRSNKKTI
jgi:hypothetical protein